MEEDSGRRNPSRQLGPRVDFYTDNQLLALQLQGETIIYEGISMLNPRSVLKSGDIDQILENSMEASEKMTPIVLEEIENKNKPKEKLPRKSIVSETGYIRNKTKTLEDIDKKRDIEKMLDKELEEKSDKIAKQNKSDEIKTDLKEIVSQQQLNKMSSIVIRSQTRKDSDIFQSQKTTKSKRFIDSLLKSWWWSLLTTCFTIYTLFSDDVKQACFSTEASPIFDGLVFTSIGFFAIELILCTVADCKYFLSFYFCLDLLATATLAMDLSYVSQTSTAMGSISGIFRSAKSAKIGSRAGTLARMFRLVGVFRMSKIFKEAEKVKQRKIDSFDKQLKRKREEREIEAKKIKEQFADLESLRKLMNSRRLQGFKFGVNTKEVIVEDEAEEPNLDHPKASKFRSALSSALNKKFNRESENTAQKNVPLTIGSIRVGTISDGKSERGYLKEGHEENPITVNTSSKSTLNISLMRAVNKFRNKSNMMKRKEGEASSIGSHQLAITQLDKSSKTKIQRQTIVGKIIIEKNTKILILLVLIMMFAMILFSGSLYQDQSQSCDSDILMLRDLRPAEGDTAAKIEFDALAEFTIHRKFEDMQIIDYHIPGFGVMERGQEYWESMVINCTTEYTAPDGSKGTMHISLWTKKQSTLEAILNILKMVFLISVLFLGSYMFTVDANTLILNPIDNIICLVNMIAKNPDVSEQLIALQDKDKNKKTNEFKQVEKAILKLGSLLVLVFGRAGNNVIYQNISNIHNEEIDVETIGSQSMAIFGFCDIRNFTDMTEILEEDIMPFVNNVARVVHNSVATFMGSANKNIGEAFLLVWNLPEECLVREESEGDLLSTSNIFLERYAESAVASFVDIIIKLESCKEVQNFADLPKVQKMLPGFKVNMGFGLHLGWAIEGAIGSEWKIDASYLSPNVNISSRLEAATMQYGVPLLISHYIVNILSQKTRNYCRKIDRVTLKGSEEPIELYTIDLRTKFQPTRRNARFSSLLNVPVQNKQVYNSPVLQLSPAELKQKYLQEDFNFNIESLVPPVVIHYLKDDRFYSQFSKAIDSYLAGKWHQARELLESCKMRRPKDGPTLNILEFINSHKSSAPQSWQGVRQLVSK